MLNTRLIEAIDEADLETFKQEIIKEGNINAIENENNYTPLMSTICAMSVMRDNQEEENYHNIIDVMLENNIFNINARDKKGDTALHLAVLFQNYKVVEKLVKNKNIDLNILNNEGKTSLQLAEENKNVLIVDIIEGKDNQLIKATVKGDLDKIKRLLNDGANINVRCEIFYDRINQIRFDGDTPLHIAAHFGHLDVMNYLIDAGADLDARCNNSNTPLINTIFNKKLDAFELLINRGTNVNLRYANGRTALHHAVLYKNKEMVNILMNNGADPNIGDCRGKTPMFYTNGNLALMESIIYKVNDIDTRYSSGRTPLYCMARENKAEFVQLLLAREADPNIPTVNGNTSLLSTIIDGRNNIESLFLLLEDKRTDLNIKNNKGECFASIALWRFENTGYNNNRIYLRLLAKHYDRLDDTSKNMIGNSREFSLLIEEYKKGPSITLDKIPSTALNETNVSNDVLNRGGDVVCGRYK
ncbi:ankyrin repeat domain-containing protein [Candidatus Mesenet endosymbiont of Agriotes lineatus]|uniref:ankyrin repeat domain-containing protein n=1 Tax=Candidatus Mesenet endosymbiont of Agriotes lineatus TaxID=3077948 RepID=UPI0030CC9A3C